MMYYEFEYKNKIFLFRYINDSLSVYIKGAAFSYIEDEILNYEYFKNRIKRT